MSRRQIRWMRSIVHGLVAALAIFALGGLRELVAEAPSPPAPGHYPGHFVAPSAQDLQDHLVLTRPLSLGFLALPVYHAALTRIPVPTAPPAPWFANLNPGALLSAMRLTPAAAPPVTAAPAVWRPVPDTAPAAASPADIAIAARPSALPNVSDAPRVIPAPVTLQLTPHRSMVLQSPLPLRRVSIADDTVASAVVITPTQVLVQGRAPGEVSLLLWDADANPYAYTVRVGLDPAPLQDELTRLFPRQDLHVSANGAGLVVSGTLANADLAKQVMSVADGYSKDVVNDLSVSAAGDPQQVLLQVRFAEMDRTAINQFGLNLLSTDSHNTLGSLSTGQFGPPTGVVSPPPASNPSPPGGTGVLNTKVGGFGIDNLLNLFVFNTKSNLGATLQALQSRDLIQILAEPNLMAMDGKDANFLAGGEFPFPVVQGSGGLQSVTIEFKPFGVNLHFKPTILADGTIDLQVAPEVSSLDFSNAVQLSGFLVPALSTRRAQTELELNDGQSFVIAGLMDNRVTKNLSKLPGIADMPILGKLFQSWSTNKSRSELMVIVTVHLVKPSNTTPSGPAMAQPFLNPDAFDGAKAGRGQGGSR